MPKSISPSRSKVQNTLHQTRLAKIIVELDADRDLLTRIITRTTMEGQTFPLEMTPDQVQGAKSAKQKHEALLQQARKCLELEWERVPKSAKFPDGHLVPKRKLQAPGWKLNSLLYTPYPKAKEQTARRERQHAIDASLRPLYQAATFIGLEILEDRSIWEQVKKWTDAAKLGNLAAKHAVENIFAAISSPGVGAPGTLSAEDRAVNKRVQDQEAARTARTQNRLRMVREKFERQKRDLLRSGTPERQAAEQALASIKKKAQQARRSY